MIFETNTLCITIVSQSLFGNRCVKIAFKLLCMKFFEIKKLTAYQKISGNLNCECQAQGEFRKNSF